MEAAHPEGFSIRAATEDDVPAILQIYNDAIETTTATFDTEMKSLAYQLEWFRGHGLDHPVLVLEIDDAVAGWASLSEYSTRCAYSRTAELSIYLDESARGRGAGTALLSALIEAGRGSILRTIIARVVTENEASIRLHRRAGFGEIGVMRQVGEKFGRVLDVCMMQYMYGPEGHEDGEVDA